MPGFRTDRLATLYVFHPVQKLRSGGSRIPILMYHSISADETSARHPYYQTTTTPKVFEQHLRFLRENDYRVVRLDELANYQGAGRAVVITFDDGFLDFYTQAFPILERFRCPASVFLPTAYIGDTAARQFKGADCMTWSQVRELQRAGVEFGSHTVTHPQLTGLETGEVREEIRRSKEIIEERLSSRVRSFAYPYAFPEADRRFRQMLHMTLEEAGYETGVCTTIGRARRSDDRFFLKRLPVNSHDDRRLFQAKLEGGYDWLHTLQFAVKLPAAIRKAGFQNGRAELMKT